MPPIRPSRFSIRRTYPRLIGAKRRIAGGLARAGWSLARCSLISLAVAVCVPPSAGPAQNAAGDSPTATPSPSPAPQPTSGTTPEPQFDNWLDAPQTPGDWTYRDEGPASQAEFGGTPGRPLFAMRCTRSTRQVALLRAADTPVSAPASAPTVIARIAAEAEERSFEARPVGGAVPMLAVTLHSADTLLDAIALSRGRFMVEVAGQPTLYLPAWTEITRVVEDCR